MCSKFIKGILWFGTKCLIIFGTVTYFVDVGSDVSFSVRLYQNCHTKYAIASICIMAFSVLFSTIFPHLNMTHIFRFRKCFASGCGYLIYYLGLNMKELFYNNLKNREKAYVHTVKFLESMIESVPQIGLAFYIIHRHGFDEPVFPEGYNFEGDLQMLSLFGSVLSITISMATRRAYHKSILGPEKKDIFIAALWNFIPLGCFLTTYYIFMSNSWIVLIFYFCTFFHILVSLSDEWE